MSQATSFTCEHCSERIEDPSATTAYEGDNPVVVYIVAGIAPMHPMALAGKGAADITDFPLPRFLRDLLAQPVARMDMCAECFAEKFSLPMVDKEGKEVKPVPAAR
jgi:hypothetical protein